ncbi:MAG TPA: ECF transporter S component [Nocardioidaceae bacterium]|jgi:energy-coupling factor transport system substrate-specific component|nr:ECF transporter S component [Actinomycetota bacterium]MDQ3422191.1 ECF transporter S component [Actinomycetota bacterium]HEV8055710.1 ECF transporter S component [Nocardioidaceae bacterium]
MSRSVTERIGASTRTGIASRPLLAWRTIDLITAALVGVTMGVVFWGWNIAYEVMSAPFTAGFAPLVGLFGGTWLLAGVLGGLIVRRPGAALFAEVLAATVSALLGNQWGWLVLVSGLLQGLGAELVFALFRYRRFTIVVAMLAGAMAAVFEMFYEWNYYWSGFDVTWKLTYLGAFMLSGAVIAGIGGTLLTRALARTGALNAMPPGREAHQRRPV